MSRDFLFAGTPMFDVIHAYPRLLSKRVEQLERDRVLHTGIDDLCDHLMEEFFMDIPAIKKAEIHVVDPEDTKIDVSWQHSRSFRENGPHSVQGFVFTLVAPFEGDPDFFKFRPSVSGGVQGEVSGSAVLLRHTRQDNDHAAVKQDFDNRVHQIEEQLTTLRNDAREWNSTVESTIRSLLAQRKKALLDSINVAESLGYPLQRREATTYEVPIHRKRLAPMKPTAGARRYTPEPALETRQYDDILEMIGSLALMIERSPSAFAGMGEEHLRDHLLVILNAHFQGQATGETFNKSGKTDILIRAKDRNIFVAECKIWDGPSSLTGAMDQILDYACWRDTKVAIVLFNRRKNFSAVVESIPKCVLDHLNCKRQLDYDKETGFQFRLSHRDDANREMTLTVLAFDVPAPTPEAPGKRRRASKKRNGPKG